MAKNQQLVKRVGSWYTLQIIKRPWGIYTDNIAKSLI
jgi:hypothetical protein